MPDSDPTRKGSGPTQQELGAARQESGPARQGLGAARQNPGSARQGSSPARQGLGAARQNLRAFEQLAAQQTPIHRLHPLAKLLATAAFIVAVASFGRYSCLALAPYLFYPFILMALADLPYRILLTRLLVALPFCLFAGISNAILEQEAAITIGNITLSLGMLSLATILLKMYLCVMAALLLVATTPFAELSAQLRRMHVPAAFVLSFEMAYRYIGVLLEEAGSMRTAYALRSGTAKAIELGHMGPFVGQLLLRGLDRAERVYAAMCCRGYSPDFIPVSRQRLAGADFLFMAAVVVPALALRLMAIG